MHKQCEAREKCSRHLQYVHKELFDVAPIRKIFPNLHRFAVAPLADLEQKSGAGMLSRPRAAASRSLAGSAPAANHRTEVYTPYTRIEKSRRDTNGQWAKKPTNSPDTKQRNNNLITRQLRWLRPAGVVVRFATKINSSTIRNGTTNTRNLLIDVAQKWNPLTYQHFNIPSVLVHCSLDLHFLFPYFLPSLWTSK